VSVQVAAGVEQELEQHRGELTAYCYRMLGSGFEAEDAVQEAFIRAWRGIDRFEGRAALRSWLYKIATNVCLDMLKSRERRARPMDLGPAQEPILELANIRADELWLEPMPDPADAAAEREGVRLAFVAALQNLPPRQRAALILCEVLRWQATEVAELLETSVASVNSALQRARATIGDRDMSAPAALDADAQALLQRYVAAFEEYDVDKLTALLREDAIQSMPPYDLWLAGREDMMTWWFGPGLGCEGSKLLPFGTVNGGYPAYAQYKPGENGYLEPWALQVIDLSADGVAELTFFIDTGTLFKRLGLPDRLDP
jgi:RNA polymerase sigma-70 factor (ECF subfamily)